jgi:hypothetical protein
MEESEVEGRGTPGGEAAFRSQAEALRARSAALAHNYAAKLATLHAEIEAAHFEAFFSRPQVIEQLRPALRVEHSTLNRLLQEGVLPPVYAVFVQSIDLYAQVEAGWRTAHAAIVDAALAFASEQRAVVTAGPPAASAEVRARGPATRVTARAALRARASC